MFGRLQKLLLTTTALMPLGLAPAAANPLGAQVVGGSATVQGQGTATVNVTQQSNSAIVNWNTFNIGAGEKTNITMPTASSVQLDRVTGGLGPSQILGSLWSNGRVFLVNPDGILFGPGAKIDTGSFLATTHDIANADFMAGRYNFSTPGRPDASVVNQGAITAQSGGFAALVAPGVRNSGTITATLGTVALASGNSFTLDFYGDKLIKLGVNDQIAAQVKDVASGQPLDALVKNEGTLQANGGRVELTAAAARQVVDAVINTTGVIEANSIGTHNGMIVLGAATGANKPAGAPTQTVKVSGKLSAAGKNAAETGGTIQITGEAIAVTSTKIDASGAAGGGKVLIGGDVGGGNPSPLVASLARAHLEANPVPTASTVTVDAATTINASAIHSGNGGKVVVWSDQSTLFDGSISVRGATFGNGGFVETSGHQQLAFNGAVDTGAPNGKNGTLLLDPLNATIDTNPGSQVITVASIQSALATGDVVISTAVAGSDAGNITAAANVSWANASTLTLSANQNITINSGVTIANTGAGNLVLRADSTGTGVGTVNFIGTGKVDFSQSTGAVSIFYNPADNPAGSVVNTTSYTTPTNYSPFVLTNGAVPNQLTAYMLVNTVYDLQNMQNNLSGAYALGKDIDASATAVTPFVPIGTDTVPFLGVFEGQGYSIDQLKTTTIPIYTGLFGYIGAAGIIRNVNVSNVNIATSGGLHVVNRYFGGLAGWNDGTISNSSSSGSIGNNLGGVWGTVGGLVGGNAGTIQFSYSSVTVGNGISPGGGLVGYNSGTISDSYATGSVLGRSGAPTASSGIVGGLVGENDTAGSISGSYATGSVSNILATVGYSGGLVGINHGAITQSYATGSTLNSEHYVGGLVAYNDGAISQSYSSGQVPTGGGGLVGSNVGAGTITNSYWDTQSSGQASSAGGTGLTSVQTRQQASYVGWDFSSTGTWFMIDGQTRPFLQSEYSTTITNAHQLQLMAMNLGATYTLANNIDLGPALAADSNGNYPGMWGPAGFVSIGQSLTPFLGTFDGQRRTIDNLLINSAQSDVGLFGYIGSAGVVRNLGLTNVAVSGNNADSVGGLAGKNDGTISQSYVSGNVLGEGIAGALVGALVGENFGQVSKSYATGTVIANSTGSAGGLVGANLGSITQSYATGTVGGGITSEAGGLVGTNFGGSITQSYSTGTVNAGIMSNGVSWGGALVGYNQGTITQSYATGSVTVVSGTNSIAGGLVAVNYGTIAQSYWDILTTGQTSVGANNGTFSGSGLTTAQLKSGLPSGFDSTVWGSSPSINNGYPYLLWQTASPPPLTPTAPPTILLPISGTATLIPITVAADDVSKVYGTIDPTLTYHITSGSLSGSAAFSGSLTRVQGDNVGTYSINLGTLALPSAYTLTYVGATLTITPVSLTITANNTSRQVGTANSAFTASYSGFVAGDGPSAVSGLTLSTPATTSSSVGTYSIIPSGASALNYTVSYVNGLLTVTQSPSVPPVQTQINPTQPTNTPSSGSSIAGHTAIINDLTNLLALIPGVSQQVIAILLKNAIDSGLQKTLLSPTQISNFYSTFEANLKATNTNISGVTVDFVKTLIKKALTGALELELRNAGYSEYLIQPASFVVTLALNDAFAVLDPIQSKFGGPEAAVTLATIQTTAGELVQVAQAGIGLWTDVQSLKSNFVALNQSVDQLFALAKAQQNLGNFAASNRLLAMAASTQTTINNLRQEYTVGGVSILDTSGWNLLAIFAH